MNDQGQNVVGDQDVGQVTNEDQEKESEEGMPMAEAPIEGEETADEKTPAEDKEATTEETPEEGEEKTTATE